MRGSDDAEGSGVDSWVASCVETNLMQKLDDRGRAESRRVFVRRLSAASDIAETGQIQKRQEQLWLISASASRFNVEFRVRRVRVSTLSVSLYYEVQLVGRTKSCCVYTVLRVTSHPMLPTLAEANV